jgi:hypothetical protein
LGFIVPPLFDNNAVNFFGSWCIALGLSGENKTSEGGDLIYFVGKHRKYALRECNTLLRTEVEKGP